MLHTGTISPITVQCLSVITPRVQGEGESFDLTLALSHKAKVSTQLSKERDNE